MNFIFYLDATISGLISSKTILDIQMASG